MLAFKSATELVAMLRDRQISAAELLAEYRSRVKRFDDKINSIIWQEPNVDSMVRDADPQESARRSADDGQGSVRARRFADDVGRAGTAQQHHRYRLRRGRAIARRRGHGVRKIERAALPRRFSELQRHLRHDEQSVGSRPHPRRLVRRIGRRARGGPDRARNGFGHRRVDPQSGALLRRVRSQADIQTRSEPRPFPGRRVDANTTSPSSGRWGGRRPTSISRSTSSRARTGSIAAFATTCRASTAARCAI